MLKQNRISCKEHRLASTQQKYRYESLSDKERATFEIIAM